MLDAALAQRVVDQQKQYPPIHRGLATATVLLVVLALATVFACLYLFRPPPDTFSRRIENLRPDEDEQERLKDCFEKREMTEYGEKGLFVGSHLLYGELYVRERIHPDDIPTRIRNMRCGPPASSNVTTNYQSMNGEAIQTDDVANICMEPMPGAANGTWGDGAAKELLRNAPIYLVQLRDTLPNICETISTELQQIYGKIVNPFKDPSLMGIRCEMYGPRDVGGFMLPVNTVELWFAWPLARDQGVASILITQYCTQLNRSTDRFLAAFYGAENVAGAKHLLTHGGYDETDIASMHGRPVQGDPGQLLVSMIEGPTMDEVMAHFTGYSIPEGFSHGMPFHEDTETARALVKHGVHTGKGFDHASKLCKNTTYKFVESVYSVEESYAGPLALYRGWQFPYECITKNHPDFTTRVSYIWPYLSIAYTVFGVYVAKLVYVSLFRTGKFCCGAQAKEVHKDDGGANQGAAGPKICKEDDDDEDDDKHAELEARTRSLEEGVQTLRATNQAQEAHIRNLESALELTRSEITASKIDLKTAQREADVVPTGGVTHATISLKQVEDMHRRLDVMAAKRKSREGLRAVEPEPHEDRGD